MVMLYVDQSCVMSGEGRSNGIRSILRNRRLSSPTEKISFDDDKKRRRRAKNKLPPVDRDTVRKSTQTIRVVLRDFCVKFLDHCYNPVMRAVR